MIDLGFEEPVNKILDALPVGNMKPDSEEAEDFDVMSKHLGGKRRWRQTMMVSIFLCLFFPFQAFTIISKPFSETRKAFQN